MSGQITIGLSGADANAAASAADETALLSVCPQERVTRSRGAGFNKGSGLPDEAIDAVLRQAMRTRSTIGRYVLAGSAPKVDPGVSLERVDAHFGHAATAYLTSPFADATIVVCDRSGPHISVWHGHDSTITPHPWPWSGPAFADLYARCAQLIGFEGEARGQRMEALARLNPEAADSIVSGLWEIHQDHITCHGDWEQKVRDLFVRSGGEPGPAAAALASALQRSITSLLLEWLAFVRRHFTSGNLCLGGTLFYHSAVNSAVRMSTTFDRVFVPVDPGVAGLSVGAALHGQGLAPREVSPLLGPSFSDQEQKATLDNCKLQYTWESEEAAIGLAVQALRAGHLVGWFDGGMEWGPRALGARSILANPLSPFALENLNHFLKQRESWRGYALSGEAATVAELFHGPDHARFMECDFQPKDGSQFRHVLPHPQAALRIQTVDETAPPRFRRLLRAFGDATGLPILVNTSFNGFQEPIVCSPRDAIRVFYGTGLDLLVLGSFVLQK